MVGDNPKGYEQYLKHRSFFLTLVRVVFNGRSVQLLHEYLVEIDAVALLLLFVVV